MTELCIKPGFTVLSYNLFCILYFSVYAISKVEYTGPIVFVTVTTDRGMQTAASRRRWNQDDVKSTVADVNTAGQL